jgi:hypothetical protein
MLSGRFIEYVLCERAPVPRQLGSTTVTAKQVTVAFTTERLDMQLRLRSQQAITVSLLPSSAAVVLNKGINISLQVAKACFTDNLEPS